MKLSTIILLLLAISIPASGQRVLYNNGPDPGIMGSWPINCGHAVSNSFRLLNDSTVTDVVLSIWDVDDRNHPQSAKWKITTEPFGGIVLASGSSILGFQDYFEGQLWTVWSMEIQHMNARLPAGTYYLEVYDVVTRWHTWAFWGENDGIGCTSVGCPSSGYASTRLPTLSLAQPISSESFQVMGTEDGASGENSNGQ